MGKHIIEVNSMKIQMQVLYLDRRLRSHQRILNISRMRVNTYENNWDECIPNVEKIVKIVQLQKAFVYLIMSIRFLNDHINSSEKAFECLADNIYRCSYPSMKNWDGNKCIEICSGGIKRSMDERTCRSAAVKHEIKPYCEGQKLQ